MKRTLLVVCLLTAMVFTTQAQETFTHYRHSLQKTGFRGFGIAGGAYFPSLDYYKDRTGYEFDVTPAFMANIDAWIYKPFAARVAVGYQKTTGSQKVSSIFTENTTITYIPISLDLLAYTTSASRFSRRPMPSYYVGLGVESTQLSVSYESTGNSAQDLTGSSLLVHGIVGLEYPITGMLKIGLEGQYTFGNYTQSFILDSGNEFIENVSLSGPKAFLTIKYILIEYVPASRKGRSR